MKYPVFMLVMWISINLAAGTLHSLGVQPGYGQMDSLDPDQVYDAFDPDQTIQSWTGEETGYEVGDPVRGLWNLWNTISFYMATIPTIMYSWGVPSAITNMLGAIWMIIWAFFAWGFISGRWITD